MNRKIALRSVAVSMVLALGLVMSASAVEIPAGTRVTVRLGQTLNSGTSHAGDTFDCTVANDVVVNNNTIAKKGAPCKGKVTLAKDSGRLHVPGQISVRLTSIDGNAVTSSAVGRKGKSHTKGNVTK